jgi:hypothetical protein
MRSAVVGAPTYFANRPKPETPQDLTTHSCINLRLPTHGGLYAWEFEKGKRELRVRVEGQLVFNATAPMLEAALAGLGLAYVTEDSAQAHLAEGRLVRVLADWCPPYSGYHLYYPSRRQPTPAFTLLVDAFAIGAEECAEQVTSVQPAGAYQGGRRGLLEAAQDESHRLILSASRRSRGANRGRGGNRQGSDPARKGPAFRAVRSRCSNHPPGSRGGRQ